MKISLKMRFVLYFVFFGCFHGLSSANNNLGNDTVPEVPVDALVNLTANNELWTMLLKDCQKPSLMCVENNMYKYFKKTLEETNDIQFTNYLKFTKNHLDYEKIRRSQDLDTNITELEDNNLPEDEFPLESMSRSLQDNAARFLMTHDVELSLPDGLFPNSVLKISPRGYQDQGTLLNLQVMSNDVPVDAASVEQGRTIKKIQKFISERLIYALIAVLIVIKLLAVKFLFILPLIVGAATAKKLLLKILLFVFPALHHLFKFCAYYPIQAKYHHHKHLISHIHQVAPTKHHYDHHDGIEISGPHSHGPPVEYEGPPHDIHHTEFDDEVSVFPDDGTGFPHGLISHRRDPNRFANDIESYGSGQNNRRYPNRPSNGGDIERIIAKAEKEALFKARLQKAQEKIREENIRLQEQLNDAVKLQDKLKQHTNFLNTKLLNSKPFAIGSRPYGNKPSPPFSRPVISTSTLVNPDPNVVGIDLPAGYIPQQIVPQNPSPLVTPPVQVNQYQLNKIPQSHAFEEFTQGPVFKSSQPLSPAEPIYHKLPVQADPHGPIFKPTQQNLASTNNQFSGSSNIIFQKSVEYDPRNGSPIIERRQETNVDSKEIINENIQKIEPKKPKIKEDDIYQAASITYDAFYSPILEKIDRILQGIGFSDEPCKERLVCSMYKSPTKFSPHSNLLSAQLSRDSSELQKPKSTNSAVIRFYKYVQAARDGQDQRDCLRLYPGCSINTDVS